MIIYTTTYPNPDTDGTSCILAYAEYLRSVQDKSADAVIKGHIDEETSFVLKLFVASPPRIIDTCFEADEIYLFDTHHISQIGDFLDCSKVIEIIDHHPSGNPEAFERATITNEQVGAAATLVTERFRKAQYVVPPSLAGLLYAAIISNTLDFTAPTTTDRDKSAAAWLANQIEIPENLPHLMFEARSNFSSRSTASILDSDCKVFTLGGRDVAICQIEGVGVELVLKREDLGDALTRYAQGRGIDLTILCVVDIFGKRTTIVPANKETRQVLTKALHLDFTEGKVTVDRILLRKSDIVPPLKNLFEKD